MKSNDLDMVLIAKLAINCYVAENVLRYADSQESWYHNPDSCRPHAYNPLVEDYKRAYGALEMVCDIIDIASRLFIRAARIIYRYFGDTWEQYPEFAAEVVEYCVRHSWKSELDSPDRCECKARMKLRAKR